LGRRKSTILKETGTGRAETACGPLFPLARFFSRPFSPRMRLRGLGSRLCSADAPDGALGSRRGVGAAMPEMRVGLGFLHVCLRVSTRRLFGLAKVLSCGSGRSERRSGARGARRCMAGGVRSEHFSGRATFLCARSPASAVRRREPADSRRRVWIDGSRVD